MNTRDQCAFLDQCEWVPTHYSLNDGSVVKLLWWGSAMAGPAGTPLVFLAENENGDKMTLLASEWEVIQ